MIMEDEVTASGSVPTTSASGISCRRLSIFKKFGCPFVRSGGVTKAGVSSPALSTGSGVLESVISNTDSQKLVVGNRERTTSMMSPQPLTQGLISGGEVGGSSVSSSSAGNRSTTRKLLEDLHRNRLNYEQDKQAYDKARHDLQDVDLKMAKLKMESEKANEKFKSLGEMAAVKRTDLNAAEIRSKVVDETAKTVEQELNQALDELFQIRNQTADLASAFLNETIRFGLQWNGTELGCVSRIQFEQQETEDLEREKRKLELELADFLILQKGVEEVENELETLNERYKELDEFHYNKELDLQKRIEELDSTLKELEDEEKEFQRSSAEDLENLQQKINEVENSITSLQNQTTEVEAVVNEQENVHKTAQTESKTVGSHQIQLGEVAPVTRDTSYESEFAARDKQNFNSFDNKPRVSRFQVPVKPQLQNQNSFGSSKACFTISHDDTSDSPYSDEDVYLMAAAAEAEQTSREHDYERLPLQTTHDDNDGPPPAKVRGVERQVPITNYMKQVSSTSSKVIKRPLKNTASQEKIKSKEAFKPLLNHVAPIKPLVPSSGKTFQFKKKSSNRSNDIAHDKENSVFPDNSVESTYQNEYECAKAPCKKDNFPKPFDDRPFSHFSSSRTLLTDVQKQRFGLG